MCYSLVIQFWSSHHFVGCSVLVVRSNLFSFGISFFLELHESTTLHDGVIMANTVSFVMDSLTQFNLFKLNFLNTVGTNQLIVSLHFGQPQLGKELSQEGAKQTGLTCQVLPYNEPSDRILLNIPHVDLKSKYTNQEIKYNSAG